MNSSNPQASTAPGAYLPALPDPAFDEHLVDSAWVRGFFGGISDMTLWRWVRSPKMDFPKPIYVNKRRLWRRGQIRSYPTSQHQEGEAA